jgi:hypothetical protein
MDEVAVMPSRKSTKNLNQDSQYIGFEVLTAVVMKSTIFWDITPCSPLKVNRRFGGTYRLNLCPAYHLLARWFIARAYSSTLKVEAKYTSETSIYFQRNTRRYIPEDSTLQDSRRSDQDSNPSPPDCKSDVLPLEPSCSATLKKYILHNHVIVIYILVMRIQTPIKNRN